MLHSLNRALAPLSSSKDDITHFQIVNNVFLTATAFQQPLSDNAHGLWGLIQARDPTNMPHWTPVKRPVGCHATVAAPRAVQSVKF